MKKVRAIKVYTLQNKILLFPACPMWSQYIQGIERSKSNAVWVRLEHSVLKKQKKSSIQTKEAVFDLVVFINHQIIYFFLSF